MGLAYLAVLTLTGATVSSTSRFIRKPFMSVYLLLISAAWVSIIDLLLQAWCYALRNELGIYLLLLAMNTTILFRLEASTRQKSFRESARANLKAALAGAALLTATGLLRELLVQGGILTDLHLLSPVEHLAFLQPLYLFTSGLHLFDSSAGAFIVFGLLLAAISPVVPMRIRSSRLARDD